MVCRAINPASNSHDEPGHDPAYKPLATNKFTI